MRRDLAKVVHHIGKLPDERLQLSGRVYHPRHRARRRPAAPAMVEDQRDDRRQPVPGAAILDLAAPDVDHVFQELEWRVGVDAALVFEQHIEARLVAAPQSHPEECVALGPRSVLVDKAALNRLGRGLGVEEAPAAGTPRAAQRRGSARRPARGTAHRAASLEGSRPPASSPGGSRRTARSRAGRERTFDMAAT